MKIHTLKYITSAITVSLPLVTLAKIDKSIHKK